MFNKILSTALAAHLLASASATPKLLKRDTPSIPGKDFTDAGGVRAAAAAAPVWLFGRQGNSHWSEPCYPEPAINEAGTEANTGTNSPYGPNPGEDCRDPGPVNGPFSLGASFPNYITTVYCGETWRITYSIYYVVIGHSHDGAEGPGRGHKHDWESATVVFKQNKGGADLWHRDALILSQHKNKVTRGWGEIQTVNLDGDLTATDLKYRAHPKIYAGFWKHANFFEKETDYPENVGATPSDEYRSDDWYYMGRLEKGDFRLGSTLNDFKDKYGGTSPPPKIEKDICGW
ncbi:MAG: hypothetical protein Q9164_004574 [Protoblastenia rupestris]